MAKDNTPKFEDTEPLFEETLPIETQDNNEISKLQSLNKGLQQGLTLGFSDEISGGIGAGLDTTQELLNKLTGGMVPKSPGQVDQELLAQGFTGDLNPEMYKEFRDADRQTIAQAQEANPATFFAGEMGGAILNPLTRAGFGAQSTLGQGLRSGAAVGSVSGAGLSEGTTLPEIGQDIAIGATIGTLAPLAPMAAKPIGKTIKYGAGKIGELAGKVGDLATDKIPGLADAIDAFKYAKAGKDVTGKKAFDELGQEALKYAKALGVDLEKTGKTLAKKQTEVLEKAKDAKIDLTNEVKALKKAAEEMMPVGSAQTSDQKELLQIANDILQNRKLSELSPKELNQLKQIFSAQAGFNPRINEQPLKSKEGVQLIKDLLGQTGDKLNKATPGLEDVNKQISDLGNVLENVGLKAESATGVQAEDLTKKLLDLITNPVKESKTGILAKDRLTDLTNTLRKVNPELADAIPQIAEVGKKLDLAQKSIKGTGEGIIPNILQTGSLNTAALAGKITKGLQGVSGNVTRLVNASTNEMNAMINKLNQQGDIGFARVLREAQEKGGNSKNALIFSLMQNPDFRKAAGFTESEENEQQESDGSDQ